jgi:hypothetical protein
MGGGGTHTTTTQGPPQLVPEGKPGYDLAQTYYQGILQEPPIYTGARVADFSGGQKAATRQAYDFFNQDSPYLSAAKAQIGATAGGGYDYLNPNFMGYNPAEYQGIKSKYDYQSIGAGGKSAGTGGDFREFKDLPSKYEYSPETNVYDPYKANVVGAQSKFDYTTGPQWAAMDDPEMQKQISAASEPIMAALTEQVMPGIRSSGSLAGQGGTSTRGDVARQQAVEGFGRTVGSSVIAPLLMQQSQLQEDYSKAIQAMKQATAEGDAQRASHASEVAQSLMAQSHDVTNQINAHSREADATNKRGYASDWLSSQAAAEGIRASYADQGTRASIANMQDATNRAIADAQARLGFANLDTGTQLSYDQLAQAGRLSYDQLMQGAYGEERNRQLTAAGMAPEMDKATAFRIGQLNQYGSQEQLQSQRELDAAKAAWEEPIFRQSSAADRLLTAAGLGPGSSTQETTSSGNWLSTIMQLATTAAAIYGMAGCSETLKAEIVDVPDEEAVVESVLTLKIKQWRYKWDDGEVKRMGPILERSPDWLKASDKTINILSLVSALVMVVQAQNKRIERLEKACSSKLSQ